MARQVSYKEMEQTFRFLRHNPVEAVRHVLNVDLPPHQRLAIKDAWEKPYNLWVWGRGAGKSIRGDAITFSDEGMLQIGSELGVTSQEEMIVPMKRNIWGFSQEVQSSHWYCAGNGPTKKITTNIGIELEGTLEHPVLVMCEDGYMRMRRLENIKPGDYVVVEHGQNYFGSSTKLEHVAPSGKQEIVNLPSHMSPKLAYWIGMTLGDGCFVDSANAIGFTGLEDTQEVWRSLTTELFGIEPYLFEDKGVMTTYAFQRLQLNNWLEQSVGMKRSISINKTVPISIRKAPKECVAAFLRGLFDTDGGVERSGAQLHTSSKKLAQQVQIILLNFGIVSSVQSKETECNDAYRVTVLSGFNEVFEQEIGFEHPEKKSKLREHNKRGADNGRNHNLSCVPHLDEIVKCLRARTRNTMSGGFSRRDNYFIKSFYRKRENQSYDKIAELLRILDFDCEERRYLQSLLDHRYFFAEVISVEDSEAVTYDFVVPEGQMFSGNGVVNHNTYSLAVLSCVTAMLRPRTRVVVVGSSFRQCLTEDAHIITDGGICSIAKLKTGQYVASENWSEQSVEHIYQPNLNPCLRVLMTGKHEFTGATHHKTYACTANGIGMYELSDLSVGDWVPLYINQQIFPTEHVTVSYAPQSNGNRTKEIDPQTKITEETGALFGYLTAKGCLVGCPGNIVFTCGDQELHNHYQQQIKAVLGIEAKSTGIHVRSYSIEAMRWMEECGLSIAKAHNKCVPWSILQSPKKVQAAFIRAYFDGDGNIYVGNRRDSDKLSVASTSEYAIKQLRVMLMNFGIYSSISVANSSRKRPLYALEIKRAESIRRFAEQIGFTLARKQAMLDEVIERHVDEYNRRNGIPRAAIAEEYAKLCDGVEVNRSKLQIYRRSRCELVTYDTLRLLRDNSRYWSEELERVLKEECDVVWVKITDIEDAGKQMTYDISVDATHTYIANGALHHNSKYVLEEIGNIYDQAPYFRACCDKKIIHNPDAVTLNLKNGSNIRAMPLGDGGKIRGARAHLLVIDETAQVPADIIDKVIMPMMSTAADPMLSVRIQKMIDDGKDVPEELLEQIRANQFVMASSAYYQFNHLYNKFQTFSKLTAETINGQPNEQHDSNYALHVYDYRDLPKGFMDQGIIEHARVSMPYYDFLMEWQAVFPPDSEGFYRMSMLDSISSNQVKIKFRGEKGKVYVLGVDPARLSDNFAIVIIELGEEYNQVVRVIHLNNEDYYAMRDKILECMVHYPNIQRIAMDTGGGGLALMDLLAGERGKEISWVDKTGREHIVEPILPIDDESNKPGLRILDMVNFAPQMNHEMATRLRAAMQTEALKLPGYQQEFNPQIEEAQLEVQMLKQELANIIAKPTRSGWPKYETIDENKQLKDRASALWLANKAALDISGVDKEEEKELAGGMAGINIFAAGV
jgi:intein/homing endonuclease